MISYALLAFSIVVSGRAMLDSSEKFCNDKKDGGGTPTELVYCISMTTLLNAALLSLVVLLFKDFA